VEYGSVADVLDHTKHPYTLGLLNSLPSNNRQSRRLKQIPGMTPSLLALPDRCAFADRCAHRTQACERIPGRDDVSDSHWVRCFNPIRNQEAA
jgi:peptide/nickel transport system ATP-binding protein